MLLAMKLRLKELRKGRQLRQDDVASMLGVSSAHISELENGKKNPSRPLLERMAKIFGVSVADMYEPETDDPSLHSIMNKMKALPEDQRRVVSDLIDALLTKDDSRLSR